VTGSHPAERTETIRRTDNEPEQEMIRDGSTGNGPHCAQMRGADATDVAAPCGVEPSRIGLVRHMSAPRSRRMGRQGLRGKLGTRIL